LDFPWPTFTAGFAFPFKFSKIKLQSDGLERSDYQQMDGFLQNSLERTQNSISQLVEKWEICSFIEREMVGAARKKGL